MNQLEYRARATDVSLTMVTLQPSIYKLLVGEIVRWSQSLSL